MKKRSSSKKSEITLNYLLKSRNVLYVVLFFSVANLFSYLMMKQLDAVAFFIIIGFLTTYFSKNMIIVMLTAMVSTFILVQFKLLGSVQEGMKDKEGMKKKEKKRSKKYLKIYLWGAISFTIIAVAGIVAAFFGAQAYNKPKK